VWLTAFGSTTLRQHTTHLDQLERAAAGEIDYDPADELPSYAVAVPTDPEFGNPSGCPRFPSISIPRFSPAPS